MSQELKRKLKAARAKLGVSQSQFAKQIGVPLKTLQNWEIDRTTPQPFALKALESQLDAILRK
jgi:putative transcriptional regulator